MPGSSSRNGYMLTGRLARRGYDWWWHSLTGRHRETGEERAFFIEYFVINPELSPDAVSYGQLSGDAKPSYFLLKAGSWGPGEYKKQLHAFLPVSEVSIAREGLEVSAPGGIHLSETRMSGSVSRTSEEISAHPEYMSDSGAMSWDLTIDKQIPFSVGYGASAPLRALGLFEMFWHAQGMKTEYAGTVTIDGETYDVTPETSFGYADKNWGTDFTNPWIWLASSDFVRRSDGRRLERSALDVGGGQPRVLGLSLGRQVLVGLEIEGVGYDFNFTHLWKGVRAGYSAGETAESIAWRIRAENRTHGILIDAQCPKDEMLLVRYENPDGKKEHNRLWNGGTGTGRLRLYEKRGRRRVLVEDLDFAHAGCEYGEY